MRSNISKGMLCFWAFFHITLVTLSSFYIKIPDWLPAKSALEIYKIATGANSTFGFFSPKIGKKARAVFDIVDQNGSTIENVALVPESEYEAHIRISGIYDDIAYKSDNPEFRKPVAASLAASVFGKYADATQVIVHVQEIRPKTMEEYRKGERAQWSELYKARFARNTPNQGGDAR